MDVEFYAIENSKTHHTDKFELVQQDPKIAILRRGQNFFIAVKFNRKINFENDVIRLIFIFGSSFKKFI